MEPVDVGIRIHKLEGGHLKGKFIKGGWVTLWTPHPDELALLNAGGKVRLRVEGAGMPRVKIDAVAK